MGNQPICKNCATPVSDKYCSACGQKYRSEKELFSAAFFFKQFITEWFNVDNKLFRSLYSLIFKPGELTLTYKMGKEAQFLKPISLFLLINFVYYFASTSGPYVPNASRLERTHKTFSEKIKTLSNERHVDLSTIRVQFNKKASQLSRLFIFTNIFIITIGLLLCNINNRTFAGEHFVFAVHYFSFLLLVGMTIIPHIISNVSHYFDMNIKGSVYSVIAYSLLSIFYFMFAYKKVYQKRLPLSFVYGFYMVAAFVGYIPVYQYILGYITLFAM